MIIKNIINDPYSNRIIWTIEIKLKRKKTWDKIRIKKNLSLIEEKKNN